ncbi:MULTISPECIES: GNAT family N-acetyltransferase [unclassified Curtobacterium]|uniref:GNAT family N-acetyltransferase n=1 Tax=unclassified Curtobacterium TaxID=257496 RepID=UPI0037FBB618
MTIELRALTADDWRVWRPVRLAALADAPDAFGSRLRDWVDAPEEQWRTRLAIPGALDLLAFDGDRAVGMASGTPGDGDRAELISMWVDPSARGRGVAGLLIDAIARWAAATGATALELAVMPDNDVARRTYERHAFTTTDEPGDLLPDGRHEVVMRRDLDADRTLDTYEQAAGLYADRTERGRSGLVDDLIGLVTAGAHVLELGSGPGRDALALEAAGFRVDRTDGARSFVERLREDGHVARVLDVRTGVFGSGYDAVFANAVLLHVRREELSGVLRRAFVAVLPGGVLAATVKRGDGEDWSTRKLDRPRHFTYWTEEALASVVSATGWTGVAVRETTAPGADERWLTVTARRPEETR